MIGRESSLVCACTDECAALLLTSYCSTKVWQRAQLNYYCRYCIVNSSAINHHGNISLFVNDVHYISNASCDYSVSYGSQVCLNSKRIF